MSETMPNRPIFIVGTGRSGTTLVRSLLSAHSRIAVTPETHFLKRAFLWGMPSSSPPDFASFWDAYKGWSRFTNLGLDAGECRHRIEAAGDTSFRAIFGTVLNCYAEKAGKPRVGEKTPGHSAFLDVILGWYPDARVIVVRRDPRAAIASQLKTPWVADAMSANSNGPALFGGTRAEMVSYYAKDWRRVYERHTGPWMSDERVMLTAYEDLVGDPRGEVKRICSFLDEEFEEAMIEQKQGTQSHEARSESDGQWTQWRRRHNAQTRAGITAQSLEKWRAELIRREVAMIEGHCEEAMKNAGYPFTLSGAERAAGRMLVRGISTAVKAEKNIVWKVAPWRRSPPFAVGLAREPIDTAYWRVRDARG